MAQPAALIQPQRLCMSYPRHAVSPFKRLQGIRRAVLPVHAAAHSRQPQHAAVSAGKQALLAAGSAALVLLSGLGGAQATDKVAEFAASGFIVKDSVQVLETPDPKVQGVSIYISDFQRSITDRLSKDFFNEPSQASVTCALTGKLAFDEKDIAGSEGQEVFSERKGLNFIQNKTLRVRRIYDAPRKTLLYVAYSTHVAGGHDNDAGRYKTSICALPLAGDSSAVPDVQ